MIKFPLLPRLSRVIVESIMNYPSVMDEVLIAVSTLSTRQAYVMPIGEEYEARNAHKAFQNPKYGDFIGMRTMFDTYKSFKTKEERSSFAKAYFLDMQTLDEIQNIHRQLSEQISEEGIFIGHGGSIDEYFSCLIAGLRQYVAMKEDNYSYKTITADRIYIHPGSSWFRVLPEYILAGEIVRTSKMYARTVSPVQKQWIDRVDPTLINELRGYAKKEKKSGKADKAREKERKEESVLPSLRSINVGKKTYFIVPLKEIGNIRNVNKNIKFYVEIDGHLSKNPIKAPRLGDMRIVKDIHLLKGKDAKKTVDYLSDSEGLVKMLESMLFAPVECSKTNYDILGLVLRGNEAVMVPFKSVVEAAEETLSSLYEMVEMIPKKKKGIFKRIYPYIEMIEDFL